mgnify:CR=1 FL=1
MLTPFHLAYHVTSLDEARAFYGGVLGCREGRSTETWVDFDFFGHQISLHLGVTSGSSEPVEDAARDGRHGGRFGGYGYIVGLFDLP